MKTRLTGSTQTENVVDLRRRAEKKFRESETVHPEITSPEAIQRLLHELQVNQIELEMQNEELFRAQAELEISQTRYFELYDMAPIGYLTLTEKLLISNVNFAAANLFSLTRSALCNEPLSRILPKEALNFFYQHLKKCLISDSPQSWEMPLERADGSIFWVLLQAVAALNGEFWITLNDITERKNAEDEICRSKQQFLAIIDASPVPLALNDKQGKITFLNRAFIQTVGYALEDIPTLADWWVQAYPDPLYRQSLAAKWQEYLKSIHSGDRLFVPTEVNLRCKDSSVRTFILTAATLQDSFADSHVVMYFDITERKQAEEENAKLTAQLQQAQKIEAIGRLAGGVAHDFNNMLGVIIGYTEMALMKLDPSLPLHADLVEVRKAAERSAGLTRQLLAFARKQTIDPRVLDLNGLLTGMLNMLERLIGENIEICWQPGTALWPVLADPSQIDQIMANLCVNVRDAIRDTGTATIATDNCVLDEAWCATHLGSVAGDYVRISVSDNGCGMDNELLEHLFEPFFTTKDAGKGTGMGLATVYGAVKQNNGFLAVDSQKGEGTTFTIYLPRHLGTSGQAQEKAAAIPANLKMETILLVEDEATILEMARVMLAMQGYTVLTANSPGKAVSLAREYEGEIDLLLTDVIMPEMNGRNLAEKLVSLYPDIKSLFMSGYTADVISSHGVLGEGISFIQKPFSREDLTVKVREVLDRS